MKSRGAILNNQEKKLNADSIGESGTSAAEKNKNIYCEKLWISLL